jgi:acyl-CoA reductase-like NAD-dependent aldehyde dehydrogenase
MMLQRARWAATAFAMYDRDRTRRIVEAVADVAYQNSERFAGEAVEETGMGVAEHKKRKNEACSRGLVERNAAEDFVGVRIDAGRKLLELPKPAGVILALTPSTDPIATTYSTVLCALMTRNAIVVSPHPMARRVCTAAVRLMARAAVSAGAPDGCLQVVQEPTVPLIESLMADPETDLILAAGSGALVRAAYRSGNPALGAGPGNVPAMVDATADIARAATCLVDSTSFDNSLLSTSESTLIAEESIADALLAELGRRGACVLDAEASGRIRATCYPDGRINTALAGKGATELAQAAGISVPAGTLVLVAPFESIVPEEPFAQEKLFPLLGTVRVASARLGIEAARALLRIGGAGHSAVIHSRNPATILAYGAALRALRISVNAPGSTGSVGMDTNLAPTMTIGTGFFGGSSLAGNLQPRDLVQWTQVAYASDPSQALDDFARLEPWTSTAALAATRIEPDAVPLVPTPPVAAVLRPSTWSAPALPGEVVGDGDAMPATAGPGAA